MIWSVHEPNDKPVHAVSSPPPKAPQNKLQKKQMIMYFVG